MINNEVALTIPEDCTAELASQSVPFRSLDEPRVEIKEPSCEPYYTSNDVWRVTAARGLLRRLPLIELDPDRSAALVIGAGSLPFTLDMLPPTVVVADLHQSVIDGVADRCRAVAQGSSWDGYEGNYADNGAVTTELYLMRRAGLARDFEQAKSAARRAKIVPALGNVMATAPALFNNGALGDKQLTFINFTNVAQYLEPSRKTGTQAQRGGRAALAALLSKLPVHEQAVICDSSSAQEVMLYTLEQYLKFAS